MARGEWEFDVSVHEESTDMGREVKRFSGMYRMRLFSFSLVHYYNNNDDDDNFIMYVHTQKKKVKSTVEIKV